MMSDFLRNDPKVLRGCILYEVLRGTPVFDAYKHFCRVIGNDAMDYREFEYWFYQYANGNSDLTCNRNPDEMKHLSFPDLPLVIVEGILGRLDWKHQLILRKVSHSFRDLADKITPDFDFACLRISRTSIGLEVGSNRIRYTEVDGGCDVKNGFRRKRVGGGDFVEMALNDMKNFFICPKLQLEAFRVSVEREYEFGEETSKIMERCFSLMKGKFKTLNHKIHVKKLDANVISEEEIMSILPFMKPGALEGIYIINHRRPRNPEINIVFNNVVELDQWKEAKILEITGLKIKDTFIDNFLHFSRFDVDLVSISPDDIVKLKNALLLSKHFFVCRIKPDQLINIDAVEQQLLEHPPIVNKLLNVFEWRFPIPNSNEFLELLLSSRFLTFYRKLVICPC